MTEPVLIHIPDDQFGEGVAGMDIIERLEETVRAAEAKDGGPPEAIVITRAEMKEYATAMYKSWPESLGKAPAHICEAMVTGVVPKGHEFTFRGIRIETERMPRELWRREGFESLILMTLPPGEEIVAMASHKDSIYIATTFSAFRVEGDKMVPILPAEPETGRWISVKEKVPQKEDRTYYWIYRKRGGMDLATRWDRYWKAHKGWYQSDSHRASDPVIMWWSVPVVLPDITKEDIDAAKNV